MTFKPLLIKDILIAIRCAIVAYFLLPLSYVITSRHNYTYRKNLLMTSAATRGNAEERIENIDF